MEQRQIKESDWKQFKKLHPIAHDRFFQKAMAQIHQIANDPQKSEKDKYWAISDYQFDQAKEARRLFADFSRSTAQIQLMVIYRAGYITEDELNTFSPDEVATIRRTIKLLNERQSKDNQ